MTESLKSLDLHEKYEAMLAEMENIIDEDMNAVGGIAFGGFYLGCTPDDNQIIYPLYWRGPKDLVLAGIIGEVVNMAISVADGATFTLHARDYQAAPVGSILAITYKNDLIVMGSGVSNKFASSAILTSNAEHVTFRGFWEENFEGDEFYYQEACATVTLEALRQLKQSREDYLQ